MSKEAVKREMSKVDRVKAERAKEQAQKEREEKEADAAQRRSFSRLLDEMKQKTTKRAERSEADELWDDDLLEDDKVRTGDKQAGNKAGVPVNKAGTPEPQGPTIYRMWAVHMEGEYAEKEALKQQVAELQRSIQELGKVMIGIRTNVDDLKKVVGLWDKRIATLEKEQAAAAEAMELIAKTVGKIGG